MKVVLVFIVLAVIVIAVTLAVDNWRLRRRIKGLDEPELWLPRRERQAHARKLLQREDDLYNQKMIDRLMNTDQVRFDPTTEKNTQREPNAYQNDPLSPKERGDFY